MNGDTNTTTNNIQRRIIVTGLGDLGFMLFLSVAVVTCGWSPNCACGDASVEASEDLDAR